MLAGQLEIQLLANIARLADDMNKAKGLVGGAMKSVESSVASAKRALGALGVGISVAAVVNFARTAVTQFIEAEQSITRFNALIRSTGDVTGITAKEIENLIQNLSDKTLIDDEQIREGVSSMLVFKNVVGDTFTEAAKLGAEMKTLGGEFEGSMEQLARALDSPKDAGRALKALKIQLTDSEEALIKKYVESGKIQAAQNVILDIAKGKYKGLSDEMNKGIVGTTKELKRSWGEMLESIGAAFAPTANSLFTWAKEGFDQIKDFMNDPSILKFLALAGGYYENAGPALAPANKNLESIQESRRQLAEYEIRLDALKGKQGAAFEAASNAIHESIKRENARLVQLQGAILAPSASDLSKKAAEDARDAKAKQEAAALAAAEAEKKAIAAAKEYQNAIKSLLADLYPLSAAYEKFSTDVFILNGLLAKGVIDQEKYNVGFDKLIEKLPDVADETKKYIEAQKELKETYDSDIKALADADAAYSKEIKSIKDATEALKPYSRETTIAAKIVELMGTHTDKTAEQIRAMAIEYANATEEFARTEGAIAAQKEIQDEMKRTADAIRDDLTDALLRGFESGKDFAQNFRDTLINMFQTLVLRPTIQGILAPVSGVLAGLVPGAASAATGGIGPDFLSSAFNALSPGGTSIINTVGAGLGLVNPVSGVGILGNGLGPLGSAVPASGTLGAFAAAVPWLAIAGAALPFISGLFDDGPAERTAKFVTGARGTNPRFSTGTPFGLTGISEDSFFSDQEMGQALDAFIAGISTTDKQIVEQLNLSTDQITAAKLNLEDLNNKTYNFGTEHEGIEGLIEITKDRYSAIFKAVNEDLSLLVANYDQADDKIGEYISGAVQLYKALDKVGDAMPELSKSLLAFASLSGQQLVDTAAIINYASADPIKDAAELVLLQSRTLAQVWNEQGDELRKLIAEYDGSATATSQLAALTQSRYQVELQLAQQIMQVLDASHQMFASSAEQIRFSVLSETEKYNSLRNKSLELEGILASATDPTKIYELAQQLNEVTTQAFGLLTAEQQKQQAEPFAKYLEGLDAIVQQKLQDVQTTLSGEHDTSLPSSIASAIEKAMEKAAAQFLAAAQTQESAANKQQAAASQQQAAANTPIRVDARVTLAGSEVGR